MTRMDVKSREYKVMLLPDPLRRRRATVLRAAERFWADIRQRARTLDIPAEGSFDEVKARRRIRFLDTVERGFNTKRYVFRERVDVESLDREVTLKFRHADRYVAVGPGHGRQGDRDAETKFEEDVKPPFTSVFSYSTTVAVDADADLSSIQQVRELFPGLEDELDELEDGELTDVGQFCARELVVVGAVLRLGKRDVEAGCALVVWHDDGAGDAHGSRGASSSASSTATPTRTTRAASPATPTTCCRRCTAS